jgi:hypothetical protein
VVRPRRAAVAGIQERGQVLGLDLRQVPWQDSCRSTHALDYDFLPPGGQVAAQARCAYLLGPMSNEDLVLLSASPDAGAGMVEGSGVQGEEDGGSDAWAKHHKR